jgi:hypothetical protein
VQTPRCSSRPRIGGGSPAVPRRETSSLLRRSSHWEYQKQRSTWEHARGPASLHLECLAGGPGFEPRLTGSEPVVLPLNYPPTAVSCVCGPGCSDSRRPWQGRIRKAWDPKGRAGSPHHPVGLFAFRTLPVFDARAVFIAFSAALILASRSTSGAGKFKAKFSLASARFKRSAFLVSEIGWPIKLSYGKTTPSEAALVSTDNPADTDAFNSLLLGAP